jgi:NTE family protein
MKALVLSGGGVLGAYEVGALKKLLKEDKNEYDILTGISVGAINTSFLAQFKKGTPADDYDKLEAMWLACNDSKIKQIWWGWRWLSKLWSYFQYVPAFWKSSVYDSSPLQNWIDQGIDIQLIQSSGKMLRVVAVSWNTGESNVATEQDINIKDWVKASSAFPCMLSPIIINNVEWMDGGVREQTPLGEAIRAGADEIDIIMTGNPDLSSYFDTTNQAVVPGRLGRVLSIFSDAIMRSDLRICGLKNDLAELKPEYKKIKIRLLQPSSPISGDLEFDPGHIRTLMQAGYEDACKL